MSSKMPGVQSFPRDAVILADLPTFDGSARDWLPFKTIFERTSSLYGYDNFFNFLRLRKALQGDARGIVEGLLSNPLNVQKIMEDLNQHFGGENRLIRSYLGPVQNYPIIQEGDLQSLMDLNRKLKCAVDFIFTNFGPRRLMDRTLLEIILDKIPMVWRENWMEESRLCECSDVRQLSLWLDSFCHLLGVAHDAMHQFTEKKVLGESIGKGSQNHGI